VLPGGDAVAAAATAPIPATQAPPVGSPGPVRYTTTSPAGGRPRTSVLILIAVLAFLLFAVMANLITKSVRSTKSLGTPPAATQSLSRSAATSVPVATPTVTVNAASYVGRPYKEVQVELAGLGLRVRPAFAAKHGKGAKPGEVVAISPTGRVPVGSTVTVTSVASKDKGKDKGNGNGGNDGSAD
ncbi:MAG: hypothetical protein WCB04_10000, partial [Mycobacteriales bacterium]